MLTACLETVLAANLNLLKVTNCALNQRETTHSSLLHTGGRNAFWLSLIHFSTLTGSGWLFISDTDCSLGSMSAVNFLLVRKV